jgi:hypothetical protein
LAFAGIIVENLSCRASFRIKALTVASIIVEKMSWRAV